MKSDGVTVLSFLTNSNGPSGESLTAMAAATGRSVDWLKSNNSKLASYDPDKALPTGYRLWVA